MATLNPVSSVSLANAHRHWKDRIIIGLLFPNDHYVDIRNENITEIIPYSEPGEMGYTIWFEVRYVNGNQIRHNGSYIASVDFTEIRDDS